MQFVGEWSDVVETFSTHRRDACNPCPGKTCAKKNGGAISFAEIKGTRSTANTIRVHAFAGDIDHGSRGTFERSKALLEAAGVACVASSTHSHRPDATRLRLVIRLSRPVPAAEWPMFWIAVNERFELHADTATKDPSRIFFEPSAPEGAEVYVWEQRGEPLDVDQMLEGVQIPDPVASQLAPPIELTPEVEALVADLIESYPVAVDGEGSDPATLQLGMRLRDRGLSLEQARPFMLRYATRCGFDADWTAKKLENAYRSARGVAGSVALRPLIRLRVDEYVANNAAAAAIATHAKVFQMEGRLVTVEAGPPAGVASIATAVVRHMLTEVADFESYDGRSKANVRRPPTEALVNYVASPGTCPDVRTIRTVLETPGIRPDFSLILKPGYDASTKTFYVQTCDVPEIDDRPTRDDGLEAVKLLRLPVIDIPFETRSDLSAYLALALTLFVRPALNGPSPLGIFDSNVRGAGKSLLADLISQQATGRHAERVTFPTGDEPEQRKQITALLAAGKSLVLWDNATGFFGGAPVDKLLTSEIWGDRRLGHTQALRLLNLTLWLANGNNLQLIGDLARRVVFVRLVSGDARPEDRSGFRIPDVRAWVKTNRGRLIAAALTILRAYAAAGCPSQGLKPFGSFESWSTYVREPLVWLGLPDPIGRAQEFATVSDTQSATHERLVAGLANLLGNSNQSAGGILEAINRNYAKHEALRATLLDLCPPRGGEGLPTTQAVGRLLSKFRQRRTADGLFLESFIDQHTKNARWRVVTAPAVIAVSAVSAPTQLPKVSGGSLGVREGMTPADTANTADGVSEGSG